VRKIGTSYFFAIGLLMSFFRHMLGEHGYDLRSRIGRLVVLVIAFEVFADHHVGRASQASIPFRTAAMRFRRSERWPPQLA